MNEILYGGNDPSVLKEASVGKVCDTYVVAYVTSDEGDLTTNDSVTFSLADWRGTEEPQCQQVIMLVNPMLYVRGWRAREAYPIYSNLGQGGKS